MDYRYKHLVNFYRRYGFEVLPPEAVPAFLAERLAQYRADEGHKRSLGGV